MTDDLVKRLPQEYYLHETDKISTLAVERLVKKFDRAITRIRDLEQSDVLAKDLVSSLEETISELKAHLKQANDAAFNEGVEAAKAEIQKKKLEKDADEDIHS